MFFNEPTVKALNDAIENFESDMLSKLDPDLIKSHAQKFSETAFQTKIRAIVDTELAAMGAVS